MEQWGEWCWQGKTELPREKKRSSCAAPSIINLIRTALGKRPAICSDRPPTTFPLNTLLNNLKRELIQTWRDRSFGIATRYALDGPAIESRYGRDFAHPSRLALGPHPVTYTMGTGSFPGVKRPGRGVGHPPLIALRLEKEYGYTCNPLWTFVACSMVNFTFYLPLKKRHVTKKNLPQIKRNTVLRKMAVLRTFIQYLSLSTFLKSTLLIYVNPKHNTISHQ